ncbi:MAG: haloalkane dehalogenase [Alphaproteobacteria bacterium]
MPPKAILPTPDPATTLSTENPRLRRFVRTLDADMAYVDVGEGDPIVFLHGNPTSSFLWRNVAPWVEGLGRVVVPDMIAHGWSQTSPREAYRFADNIAYFDAFFEALGLTRNVVLVLHDWGAAVGFHRAARFPQQVQAIAYMESMVRPRLWSDLPAERVPQFKWLRTPEGRREAVAQSMFVEKMLFERGILRALSDAEKEVYRRPVSRPGGTALPHVIMPNDIPFDGEPADNAALVKTYADWLATTDTPKLLVVADEGHGLANAALAHARAFRNQTEVTVHGRHYLQEDAPDEIGAALAAFVRRVRGA